MEPERSLPHSQVPATYPILSQIDPVHTPISHFLKIHLNIIHPSMSGSSKWFFPSGFPTKILYSFHTNEHEYVVPQQYFFKLNTPVSDPPTVCKSKLIVEKKNHCQHFTQHFAGTMNPPQELNSISNHMVKHGNVPCVVDC